MSALSCAGPFPKGDTREWGRGLAAPRSVGGTWGSSPVSAAAAERVLREPGSCSPAASPFQDQPPPSQPRADFASSSPASLPKAAAAAGTQLLERCFPTSGRPAAHPSWWLAVWSRGKPPGRRKAFARSPKRGEPSARSGARSPGRKHSARRALF